MGRLELNDPESDQRHHLCHHLRKPTNRWIILFVFVLFLCGLVALVVCLSSRCFTRKCLIGRRMASHMNLTADPCHDFYEYSCGAWVERTVEPTGIQTLGTGLYHVHHENARKVEELVYQAVKRDYELSSERKVKTLATQCVDAPQHEARIKKEVIEVLTDMVGEYPLPLKKVSEKWYLSHAVEVALLKLKAEALFEFAPLRDILGDERYILALDQSGLSLSHPKFYQEDTKVSQLKSVVQIIGSYLDMSKSEAQVFADSAIDFEKKLAAFSKGQDDESRLNLTSLYGKRLLSDLAAEIPAIDIQQLFRAAGYNITKDYHVIVTDSSYFAKLNKLLQTVNPVEIQNYLVLQMINRLAYILPGSFPYDMISKEKYKEYCVQLVTGEMMPASTGALYVEEHFSAANKQVVEEMIRNIKEVLIKQIRTLNWMSEHTKQKAVDKANAMLTKMGYPEQVMNTTIMDAAVASFKVDKDETIFQSWMNWSKYFYRETALFLGEKTERTEWHNTNAAVVNAFNDLAKNSIEFPAGVFEVPLFDMEAPMYVNYGAIGSIIGHEITHGFDRAGMQFDAEGAMVNWWSNASVLQYENKSECYIKHFGKFKAGEEAINPLLSLGENVADSGGIKLAKMAYEHYAEQLPKESPLPGFAQFSPQQLFYIAFAQAWCDKSTEFQLEQTLLSDPHLPGEPRVSGTISLQPGFAKAFKCPTGSRMNPPQKCSMWSN